MGKNNHALLTGLFVLALLAITTSIIYWIGHFDRERNIYVIASRASVSGLTTESTVFFRGIAVGKVLKIEFDPSDADIIVIPIEVDKQIVLTKGVYATLRLKGVTGLTQIQLEDSNNIPEALPPGGSLEARIPLVPSATDRLLNSGEELLKKADHIMQWLSEVLTIENEQNITEVLSNLTILSRKMHGLQLRLDSALASVPALSKDVHVTLEHINHLSRQSGKSLSRINDLTSDLQKLTLELHKLSAQTSTLANTGEKAGEIVILATLPKVNKLLTDLQAATQQVKRVAAQLENNPQALLLGPVLDDVGPGEPGFKEKL